MKAMILAAGLGKRMRPLTEHAPKPLLKAGGKYLIEYHLERVAKAGIKDIVVNTHWLGEQLPDALGSGEKWGLTIHFAHEPVLLETAGGIIHNLDQLSDGDSPFVLINGDIFTDLDLTKWLETAPKLNQSCQAYLGLVQNPDHNLAGDFSLDPSNAKLHLHDAAPELPSCTYAGIALLHPGLFAGLSSGPRQLGPLLKDKIKQGRVCGSLLTDFWLDVGTPERLEFLKKRLSAQNNNDNKAP